MHTFPKVHYVTLRWSQDAKLEVPVTLLDKLTELRIALPDKRSYKAKFDEDGLLVFRGGVAGEMWLPVLTTENTWIRRITEGALSEVYEVPPELPE